MLTTPRRPRGPTDRDRATRIAAATIQVLRRSGINGLTHRAVATEAGVPLGSTTYHFSTRQELLAAALRESIRENEALIEKYAVGLDRSNVAARLAALLQEQTTLPAARNQVLVEHELYVAASRDETLSALSRRWDAVLRTVLNERIGPTAGRIYHAVYMGLLMQSLVTEGPLDSADLERLLGSLAIDEPARPSTGSAPTGTQERNPVGRTPEQPAASHVNQ